MAGELITDGAAAPVDQELLDAMAADAAADAVTEQAEKKEEVRVLMTSRANDELVGDLDPVAPTSEEVDDDWTYIGEGVKALAGGVQDAVNGTVAFLQDFGFMGVSEGVRNSLAEMADAEGVEVKSLLGYDGEAIQVIPPNNTVGGKVARAIFQFAIPYIGLGKVASASNAIAKQTRLARWGADMGRGAVVDFTVFDENVGRLSDMLEVDFPEYSNVITGYLVTDPEDDAGEARLKTALEGVILGSLGSGIVGVLGMLRGLRGAAKAAGDLPTLQVADAGEIAVERVTTAAGDGVSGMRVEHGLNVVDPMAKTPNKPGVYISPETIEEGAEAIKRGDFVDVTSRIKFNFDNIDVSDDAADIINETSAAFEDIMVAAKRGEADDIAKMSHQATSDLADVYLMDPQVVNQLYSGTAGLAARGLASRHILAASSEKIVSLLDDLDAGREGAADEYVKQMARHATLQAQISGSTTEVARSLNAHKIKADPSMVTEQNLKLAMEATAGTKDALKRARLMHSLLKTAETDQEKFHALAAAAKTSMYEKVRDAAIEVSINGRLSGLPTQVANFIGNTSVVGLRVFEKTAAAAVGSVSRSADRIRWGEVVAHIRGIRAGAADALRLGLADTPKTGKGASTAEVIARDKKRGAVWEVLRTGDPQLDDIMHSKQEGFELHKLTANAFGLDSTSWAGSALNRVGTFIQLPGRGLLAGDELFKNIAYRAELAADAYRTGIAKGLNGRKELDDYIREVSAQPTAKQHASALEEARKATFTNDLGNVGKAIQGFIHAAPETRLFMPFIRTPIQLMKYSLRRATAPVNPMVYINMAKGGKARDEAIGHLATAAAMGVGVAEAMERGMLVGAEPRDPKERDAFKAANKLPYSLVINDKYYQFNRLDPLASLIGSYVDLGNSMKNFTGEDVDYGAEAFGLLADMTNAFMLEKTFAKNASDFLLMISDYDRYGASFVGNLATGLLPYSSMFGQMRRQTDPYIRMQRGEDFFGSVGNAYKNKISGMSDELPHRRGFFGEMKEYPDTAGPIFLGGISPVAVNPASTDEVLNELIRQRYPVGGVPRRKGDVELSTAEQSRWQELFGTVVVEGATVRTQLKTVMDSYEYANLLTDSTEEKPGSRMDALVPIVEAYRSLALHDLRMENPEVDQKFADDAALSLSVKTGVEQSPRNFLRNQ